jgi:hypothetical protein
MPKQFSKQYVLILENNQCLSASTMNWISMSPQFGKCGQVEWSANDRSKEGDDE